MIVKSIFHKANRISKNVLDHDGTVANCLRNAGFLSERIKNTGDEEIHRENLMDYMRQGVNHFSDDYISMDYDSVVCGHLLGSGILSFVTNMMQTIVNNGCALKTHV